MGLNHGGTDIAVPQKLLDDTAIEIILRRMVGLESDSFPMEGVAYRHTCWRHSHVTQGTAPLRTLAPQSLYRTSVDKVIVEISGQDGGGHPRDDAQRDYLFF